jgi:hypothetical protein
MDPRFVIGEDQQHGGIEPLCSLMEFEGGNLVAAPSERALKLDIELLRAREPLLEVCSGEPASFSGVPSRGEIGFDLRFADRFRQALELPEPAFLDRIESRANR